MWTRWRASKYGSHCGSYGLASALMFVCRRFFTREARYCCTSWRVYLASVPWTNNAPMLLACGPEGLVPNPLAGFGRVSTPRPLPQQGKDRMGATRNGPRARPVLVRLRPTPNRGVPVPDQVARAGLLV